MIRILTLATLLIAALMGSFQNAKAVPIVYTISLSGANESPPNASQGIGSAEVDFDIVAHSMRVLVTFSDLLATTTASHIHCPTAVAGTGTAGVATQTPTFTGFPLGVTSGTYDHTFDTTLATTYSPAFIAANGGTTAGAEAALAASLAAGTAYLNIHTTLFPGGEIRGFIKRAHAVNIPAIMLLIE